MTQIASPPRPWRMTQACRRRTPRGWPARRGTHLRDVGADDPPEIARRLMAGPNQTGATPANVVAKAACDHCQEQGIDPRA